MIPVRLEARIQHQCTGGWALRLVEHAAGPLIILNEKSHVDVWPYKGAEFKKKKKKNLKQHDTGLHRLNFGVWSWRIFIFINASHICGFTSLCI